MLKVRRGRRSRPASLRDVAAATGVSVMTVSNALSGRGRIADDTRRRIRQAADELMYRPNRLVHAIRTGQSGTVGVVVNLSNSYTALLVRGIHNELARSGRLPILHFTGVDTGTARDTNELAHLHRLLDHRVDGIIFWPSDETVPASYLHEVWDRGIPLVAVDRRLEKTNADFSGTDDVAGGRLMMDHALALGHRHIAHLAGDLRVSTFAERLRGCRVQVGKRRDVSFQAIECGLHDCRDRVLSLLRASRRPTAILAASDLLAQQAYEALEDAGLRVGQDVSVIGFADLPEAQWLQPKLTTIRQDFELIGRNAARLILDRLTAGGKAGTIARNLRIAPELVVRGSSAPPSLKHQ